MDKLDFMDTILNFLLKLILKHYLILRILYFGLIYGPRYLLAIIFFIESIFFGRLNFFYSFLPLLFVPLLCQYILFTLKDFTETSLENLNNCLDVTVLTETQQYKANVLVYQDYILSLDPDDEYKAVINFQEHIQIYLKEQGRNVFEETKLLVTYFIL